MIQKETVVDVIDNSGALQGKCFCLYKCGRYARVGDVIKLSVVKSIRDSKVKKGTVHKALVVMTKSLVRRKLGDSIRFSKNAVVLLNEKGDPLGTRILGVVPRESAQQVKSLARGVC